MFPSRDPRTNRVCVACAAQNAKLSAREATAWASPRVQGPEAAPEDADPPLAWPAGDYR